MTSSWKLATAKNISASASTLCKDNHSFDMYCLPPGPDIYHPNKRFRALHGQVLTRLRSPDSTLFGMAKTILNITRASPRLFRKVSSSEDNANRKLIYNLLATIKGDRFELLSEEALAERIQLVGGFRLASQESKPEPAIVDNSFILLASEAKGFFASSLKCLPQGCQVAGDATILLRRCDISLDECATPGIVVFADSVQIFGCHLLPTQYPVFSLLSRAMSLASSSERLELAAWLLELRAFIATTRKIICASSGVKPQQAGGVPFLHPPLNKGEHVELDVQKIFLKPIRLRMWQDRIQTRIEVHPYRVAMTRTLEVFDKLNEACIATSSSVLVTPPLGWLQVPGSEQPQIRDAVFRKLQSQFLDIHDQQPSGIRLQPCFAFPNLLSPWTSRPPQNCTLHTQQYIDQLTKAIHLFKMAKVVHMDLRPANIMWKCSCMDSKQNNHQDVPEHELHIRVIDWEDAHFLGEFVDPACYIQDEARRYPLSKLPSSFTGMVPVQHWMDEWSLHRIALFLRQEKTSSFSSFMHDRPEDDFMRSELQSIVQHNISQSPPSSSPQHALIPGEPGSKRRKK